MRLVTGMVLLALVGGMLFAGRAPQSVIAGDEDMTATTVNVQLILDVSGSMAQVLPMGQTRMDAAKQVMRDVIDGLPEREGVNVGLRIYGHEGDNTEAGRPLSCQSSELVVPMDGVDKTALRVEVDQLQPTGWTPLALSLERAGDDFTPANGDVVNVVVLVTDGLETCDGDPVAVATALHEGPAAITTHVIAFALTAEEQALVSGIAEQGGGRLLGADDADELSDAIFAVLVEEVPDIVTPTPRVIEGPIGTRENPVPMGTEAAVGSDWSVTVVDTIPYATDIVAAENPFNDPPPPGQQFFIATVTVTYQGSESGNLFGLSFQALGDSAVSYTTFGNYCGVIPNDMPMSELFPGGTVQFNVCWSVQSADVDSLVMFVDPLFMDRDRVWFALHPE